MSLFRVGGTEVRVDLSWLLIFGLILVSLSAGYFPRLDPEATTSDTWLAGFAGTLLFFASILIHEASHALVARAKGIPVPVIRLFLFGGVSELEDEARTPGAEFQIAVVGPLTSFALAALFWGIGGILPSSTPLLVRGVIDYVAFMNVALGAFNLLPGFPLDGGRVLRAAVWWRTGSLRRGTRVASDVGKGMAVGLMVLGALEIFFSGALVGGLWLILIGLFLRGTAEAGYQNLVMLQALEDVTAGDVAVRDVVVVPPEMSIQHLIDDALLSYGYRAFPVVEHGEVRGLISISDLKELPAAERDSTTVEQRMLPVSDAVVVAPETALTDALRKLALAPGGRLLVMRGPRLVGLLTKSGLGRFVDIRRVLDASPRARMDVAASPQHV